LRYFGADGPFSREPFNVTMPENLRGLRTASATAGCRSRRAVRQKSRDRLRRGRQRADSSALAPRLENLKIASVRPPRGRCLLFKREFKGAIEILADLPAYARYGVFSEPRVFPAVVRFSNGEPAPHPDRHPEPRGIAIKLIGMPGRKLLPGHESDVTQDFLATSHSVTSTVRSARQFIAFIRASRNRLTLPITLARAVGVADTLRILKALVSTVVLSKVRSMATEQFSSTAPIKLGPYAVKFTVQPAPGTPAPRSRSQTDNFLRDELADRLRKEDLVLDFLVQFYMDETRTPIEDTSIPWRPGNAPLVQVAQLRMLRCDFDDPRTRALSEAVDRLSFSPWHATEDHRPLGNVMRARRVAYAASSALRGHSPEPTSICALKNA
jgi:hypothetical protein